MTLYIAPTLKLCSRGNTRYLFRAKDIGGIEESRDNVTYLFHEGLSLIVTEQMQCKRRSVLYVSPSSKRVILTAAMPYAYEGPVLVPEEAMVCEAVDIYQVRDARRLLAQHTSRMRDASKQFSIVDLQRFYESFTAALPER